MIRTLINLVAGFGTNQVRKLLVTGVVAAGLGGTAAFARHPDFHLDVVVPAPPVCVEPIGHAQRVWVEPVYRTVTEQVWVPAVTQQQIQRVAVPAQYEWRDVVAYDYFGRPRHYRQQVQVCPAHVEDRTVDVVICPGHYEQQTHEQLVYAGHWADEVVVRPDVRFGFHLPF